MTEYLDGPGGAAPDRTGGRRAVWAVAAVVAAVALLGAGGWAAWSFFSTGPQPAEALPASTLAYVSVDLDPSGGQKIEALRTLRKFPEFEDEIGLDTDDDVRRWIVEEGLGCDAVDYDTDVEPWLGNRVALAAVDTGSDEPVPVVVLQQSDADAADTGLTALAGCGELAWSISGDWAVLGETEEIVTEVARQATEATLADDEDFRHWTGAAGDAGIATAYVAPEAADAIREAVGCEVPCDGLGLAGAPEEALDDFGGLGATLRFADGSVELEMAAEAGSTEAWLAEPGEVQELVASLPDDTAAVAALRMPDLAQLTGLVEMLGVPLPGDADRFEGEAAAFVIDADGAVDVVGAPTDAQDGGLSDTGGFRHAVPDADDAGALVFANLGSDALTGGIEGLEPLEAAGASVWSDGSTRHLVLRVTTD